MAVGNFSACLWQITHSSTQPRLMIIGDIPPISHVASWRAHRHLLHFIYLLLTRRRCENLKLIKCEKCNAVRNSNSRNYVEKGCLNITTISSKLLCQQMHFLLKHKMLQLTLKISLYMGYYMFRSVRTIIR
jgi:hypothetical protein